MKRGRHGKYGLAMLNGDDAPGREAFPVTDAINVVNDRNLWVSPEQEISVQRVRPSLGIHRAARRHQSLPDDLSAEDPLPARLRRASAKQVHLELFKIQDSEKVGDCGHPKP